ncbi:MAG: cupin domain-containing protein [Solirubrobacterales bacterium]
MRKVNIAAPRFEYDGEDPDGFRAGMARLGKLLGASESGVTVYELPPGQSVCPYHYEVGEEEWLLVLEGNPTLRHPGGSERLDPWDVVCFPRGPEGAHGVGNETERPARVLMLSTVVVPTATVYPDSDKVGIWTGDPETDVLVRRGDAVDYYEGER